MRGLFSTLALPLLVAGFAAALPACPGNSDAACVKYESHADLTQPKVTFRANVAPLLAAACAFSACHGNESGGNQGVYLGGNPSRAVRALVGVGSTELTTMKLVQAGDPNQSYLQHKLDGDACQFDAACTDRDCLAPMPRDGALLSEAERDVFRRWIAQGAKDD